MTTNAVVIGTHCGDAGKGRGGDWLTDHARGVGRDQRPKNAMHSF